MYTWTLWLSCKSTHTVDSDRPGDVVKIRATNKCYLWLSFLSFLIWVSAKICLICWKIEPWPEIPEMRWICSVMHFQKWYLSLRFTWRFPEVLNWKQELQTSGRHCLLIRRSWVRSPQGPPNSYLMKMKSLRYAGGFFLFRTLWTYNYRGRRRHPVASPSNWFADSRVCFYDTLMVI